jgi:hypothetical protein
MLQAGTEIRCDKAKLRFVALESLDMSNADWSDGEAENLHVRTGLRIKYYIKCSCNLTET